MAAPAVAPTALTLEAAARMMREAHKTQPTTWIYAIRAGHTGPVKIGITNSPAKRLATLQQANSDTLRGLACWRDFPFVEKQLHAEFQHARIRGEWFRPIPELLDLVVRLGGGFEDWRPE